MLLITDCGAGISHLPSPISHLMMLVGPQGSPEVVGFLFFGRLVFAVLLWLLVGSALQALLRDLRQAVPPSEPVRAPASRALLVVAAAGSMPGLADGMQYPVSSRITIGRSPDSTVRLDDPFVSLLHARIQETAGGFVLEDMGSRNGTLWRGNRIDAPVSLADGDEIRVGSAVFVFYAGPA